jgi:AraC-like DNA-binding protein
MALSLSGSAALPSVGPLRIQACGDSTVDAGWSIWEKPYRTWNHTVWQIIEGDCTLAFDDGEWRLRPGLIHLVPGHRFARRKTVGMRHRWINYNLDLLSADLHLGRLEAPLSLPLAEYRPWSDALAEVGRVAAAMPNVAASIPAATIALIEGCLLQAVGVISARVGAPPADFSGDALRTALAYIERHYRRMPSLGEIAQACDWSPNHLQSRFTKTFGVSPTTYARSCRLRDAVHLLTASELQIQEIARRCGYEDPLHFSRVFSRTFGCSPLTVRQAPEQSAVWRHIDRSLLTGAIVPHAIPTADQRATKRRTGGTAKPTRS